MNLTRKTRASGLGCTRRGRKLILASAVTLLTLLIAELALALSGMQAYFAHDEPTYRLQVSDWSTCDAAGCHYVQHAVAPACADSVLKGRVCAVNPQGYSDSDNFVWQADYQSRPRILLVGDSVTYGMSADADMSFAEKLDQSLPEAVIWNTGIPGGGTNQAIKAFNVYAEVLQPHLTVLGFYQNDFDDNLMPVDSWLNAIDQQGNAVAIRTHIIDERENVFEFDIGELEYFRSFWHFPPRNVIERLLGSTRLGSLLLRLADTLEHSPPSDSRFERREQVTRQYLRELRDAVAAQGSEFLILLIPGPYDIGGAGMRYQLAQQIVSQLEIAHVNPIGQLEYPADYAPAPDDHWSNSGHQKIGAILVDCVNEFIASGDIANCPHVTIPRN